MKTLTKIYIKYNYLCITYDTKHEGKKYNMNYYSTTERKQKVITRANIFYYANKMQACGNC